MDVSEHVNGIDESMDDDDSDEADSDDEDVESDSS